MKKIFALMSVFMLAITLTACIGGTVTGEDGAELSAQIIIYTNQTSGGRGAQLDKMIKAQNFPFEVLTVELAGQNLKNRLINEINNPFADVILGGSTGEHIELKDENVLYPYKPTWLTDIDEMYHEASGYFSTWAIEPLYLVYNKKYYTNNSSEVTSSLKLAPTSWSDLSTNFKGKYNVFKPSSTSGSNIYASILSQHRDDNGDLGVSQAGWNLLSDVINNGILDAGLWQANLAGNKSPIAMSWAGAVIEVEDAYEVDLEVIVPTEGVPASISQIAIVDSKKEPRINAAKMFVEWWGKAETQVAWSKVSGQAPASKVAINQVDQRIKDIANVKIMNLDWNFIAKYSSQWREKIELEIIK